MDDQGITLLRAGDEERAGLRVAEQCAGQAGGVDPARIDRRGAHRIAGPDR
jgi:hypothetical protein